MPPSIRRPLIVAAALLALAAPLSAVAATDPADPRAPVAALYAIEKAGRPTLTTPAERAASLTRNARERKLLFDRAAACTGASTPPQPQ